MVHGPQVTHSENGPVRKAVRIVVLEDNPAEARLLQERLFEVASEFACDFASELWEVSPERLAAADCAVIDLGLPDSSGLEALGWIRNFAPEIPIVVLTGLDDEATALVAIEHGAQEYLVKDHADGFTIARAIRYAIMRMTIQKALDRKLLDEVDLRTGFIQQLLAIGTAMAATQSWVREPAMANRMSDHVSAIMRLGDNIQRAIKSGPSEQPEDPSA